MMINRQITFIIQARLASTRLPGKIIRPFYKQESIIQLLLKKLKQYDSCKVILATSTDESNDRLVQIADEEKVICYRGSENDVLQRFIEAAASINAQRIIRVCSDNPFLNEQAIETLLKVSENSSADYISFLVNGSPSIKTHFGFWTEYVTLNALKQVRELTNENLYHEHVTNYIYTHPESFQIEWLPTPECLCNRNDIRLTCDTQSDFQNAQSIYEHIIDHSPHPTIEEVVHYIDAHPEYLNSMRTQIQQNTK